MSLFVCDKCSCIENTALTDCYHCVYMFNSDFEEGRNIEAMTSYKKVLGLKMEEPFGHYCSACCPVWYNDKGMYGIGPNPNPKEGEGEWHNGFERRFLPKGIFETNPNTGNLRFIGQKEDAKDMEKYFIHLN